MNEMTAAQRTSIGWATAALGLAGLVCGIVALAADLPFFGLIAGILAVGAGAAGLGAAYMPAGERDAQAASTSTVTNDAAPTPTMTSTPVVRPPVGSVDDDVTGLRSEAYFMAAAGDRIDAARRYLRPVSLLLLDLHLADGNPVPPTETGETLTETLREADMICRRRDGSFAILLEDTPETGALLVVERLRPALRGRLGDVVVRAGVACYPAHGLDLAGIWTLGESALTAALTSERDSTHVADTVDTD